MTGDWSAVQLYELSMKTVVVKKHWSLDCMKVGATYKLVEKKRYLIGIECRCSRKFCTSGVIWGSVWVPFKNILQSYEMTKMQTRARDEKSTQLENHFYSHNF